ncbi:hypothetical protein AOLI_G00043820 [Acnodon oligacanthus]
MQQGRPGLKGRTLAQRRETSHVRKVLMWLQLVSVFKEMISQERQEGEKFSQRPREIPSNVQPWLIMVSSLPEKACLSFHRSLCSAWYSLLTPTILTVIVMSCLSPVFKQDPHTTKCRSWAQAETEETQQFSGL